jgi:hypothetical protein
MPLSWDDEKRRRNVVVDSCNFQADDDPADRVQEANSAEEVVDDTIHLMHCYLSVVSCLSLFF